VKLTYPRVVFVAFLLVTLTILAVAIGTSSATYGSYNYDWDRTSDIRLIVADTGADIEIVRSEARYRRADAETATAFGLDPTETHSDSESGAVASFLDYSGTVIVAAGPDLREPVSRDPRDGDRVLWSPCRHPLTHFAEDGQRAEVLLPVVAPDLVPRRDERRLRAESREFRREDGEVREDAGDDNVMFVVAELAAERGERPPGASYRRS
jgi:hypothetical protein